MEKTIDNLSIDGKLKIIQIPKIATYTFDSIQLSKFIKIRKNTNNIVDLCSGNGSISMLLTTHDNWNENIKVTQVEIQKLISDIAEESIKLNNLKNFTVVNENLIGINEKIGFQKSDLVVCNPPYFEYDETKNLRISEHQAIARHEIMVNLEDIVKEAKLLLNHGGYFCMVHRPDRIDSIIDALNKNSFSIKRIQFIYTKKNKSATTVMIEARKGTQGGMIVEPPINLWEEVADEIF